MTAGERDTSTFALVEIRVVWGHRSTRDCSRLEFKDLGGIHVVASPQSINDDPGTMA